jgi:hypothetical protein
MRPHGRHAIVAPQNPEAFAQCDRCGDWWNRSQLMWQMQWSGTHLYNLGILVCPRCIDVPQEQLRTIILPPDPPPVINARPPNFTFEEEGPVQSTMAATVLAGTNQLPVVSVAGFVLGDNIWIQLNNATFQQALIINIDPLNNILTIGNPLTGVAPYTGSVTVADTQVGD